MKKMFLSALFLSILGTLQGNEPIAETDDNISSAQIRPCARCVEAREYNRAHPNEYFYYEDYLEAQEKKGK